MSFNPSLSKIVFQDRECIPKLVSESTLYSLYDACGNNVLLLRDGSKLGVRSPSAFTKAEVRFDVRAEEFLALTLAPIVKYGTGYKYYNELYTYGKTSAQSPANVVYPDYVEFSSYNDINEKATPCWTYAYTSRELHKVIYPTVAVLLKKEKYEAYVVNSAHGLHPSLTDNGLLIEGHSTPGTLTWVLFRGENEDPYSAIREAFVEMSKYSTVKLREEKPRPKVLGKLGWCSWNAFLTNVSEEEVVKTVRGLKDRGVKLGYVLIDDGWQERGEDLVLLSLDPDKRKFPRGFPKLREEVGTEGFGLWLTINLYWKGFSEKVKEELGEGEANTRNGVPDDLNRALTLYHNLFRRIKGWGFSFVKVDNQWSVRLKESPENIQLALQLSAYGNGLEVLNCMSMVPECYSHYFLSNIMRTSTDYIPMWKEAGKLHILFNAYNSLFFSNIVYPDYDMFSSYDPYALAHLIARVFSGGPIYITDRDAEKTDVGLLRKVMVGDGVSTVDFPGVVTRDLLFRNPYKEEKLLKIASKSNGIPVLGAINVNEGGKVIKDRVDLSDFPFPIEGEDLMYYKVLRQEYGDANDLTLELGEMEGEVVVIAERGTPIGFKGYLLPPSTLKSDLKKGTMIILDDPLREVEMK
ncbi:Sip1-related alpha-galactosidase [Stygiolobus caldivivus]|uniref:Alpha-galactosidase n=1 Tax=Stygiolobus caldivivus TaxID=2824673 RepID=A0A8D5U744_9CREN|nr:Sip1-related alpha-galactosidase [Stygiolobus caldivivus]BCU70029.1 alpha-galactosidase [Stygiolobus caldivivus]